MHIRKRRQRGYNQSELLAREIARNLQIEIQCNNLIKIKDTAKQSALTKKQRKENVKGAYSVKQANLVRDKKIILFDDIFTTGSTVDECSKILKQAGVKGIVVLTLATD